MSLEVVPGGRGGDEPDDGPRVLATGAPPSPGPAPNELAMHLRHGEPLIWWGVKDSIAFGPIGLVFLGASVVLGLASALAPGLWSSWSGLWPPLLALFSPSLFLILREWMSRRAVLVTDSALVVVDLRGNAIRLPFDGVARVRRDPLRGGLRLEGRRAMVQIPGQLVDDTRRAIASQRRDRVGTAGSVDDPLGWMP